MEFRILGPLEVSAGDGALKVGGPKQRAVLAHLILRANHPVPIERLIDGLWGEEPPETARNTLQTYVYRLRQVLGEDRIGSGNGGYVLHAEASEIDAARFEAMVRQAKAEIRSEPARAAEELGDALALWRGSPLSDLSDEPSLRGEIARLEELRLSATEHRISAEIATGGHSTVVSELEALTARYPLRERMWANLMLALYRMGRQAEALSAYQRAREVLADELGAEPSADLQHLHEQILRRDPVLGQQEPPRRPAVKPSRVDLQPGTEFAGYRIVSTLGRGGMAVVYLAEHDWLQRKVALKVLAPQLTEDERFRERFVRESRLAASLDHPNVVPIYEAGASGGDLFIAMRYVEGTDLRTVLAESGPLDPARAIGICRQVAAALDAAHEQGLVHRDVKPGNVLVARARGSEAGEHVYLSDFGLTKRSTSESGVTGTGQFVGTLDYAAPEQFQGGTPDARTDVYSLGCVLFECLTGHPPFRSENDAGLMYAHLQEQPPRVTVDRPELPKEIDAVIARAMAKAPEVRQPSAGALIDEAARALHVGAQDEQEGRPRSSLRTLVSVIAVVAALVVGILMASILQGESPELEGAGGSSHARPGPTIAPAFPTVHRALNEDEKRLLASIPPEARSACLPLDRPEPVQNELAALACDAGDVEVLYELFPTRTDLDAAIQQGVNSLAADEGNCATDTLAISTYTTDGNPAGRVLCYTIVRGRSGFGSQTPGPDQSHIEWTDENTLIFGHAVRNDLGDLNLYEWWLTSAGPLVPGTTTGAPARQLHGAPPSPPPAEGTYLVSPSGGCGGQRNTTCAMHIEDGEYQLTFTGESPPSEIGNVIVQKPNHVVFAPKAGYCFRRKEFGESPSTRPGAYTWSTNGNTISFRQASGGQCAGPAKLDLGESWTVPPSGAMALEQGGEIEILDGGGTALRSTTEELTNPNIAPDWSPDGSRIVFAGASEQGFDLYVMEADGSGLRRIAEIAGDEVTPAWSPDGTRIAFSFDDQGDPSFESGVVVMQPDGQGRTELVTRESETVWDPIWSPDGREIVFTIFGDSGPRMYLVPAGGGQARRLPTSRGIALAWTPDKRIVFASRRGGALTLMSTRRDGSSVRSFIEDPPTGIVRPFVDLSPDGRWIVLSNWWNAFAINSSGVYLVPVDGGQAFQIATGTEATWRPTTD